MRSVLVPLHRNGLLHPRLTTVRAVGPASPAFDPVPGSEARHPQMQFGAAAAAAAASRMTTGNA